MRAQPFAILTRNLIVGIVALSTVSTVLALQGAPTNTLPTSEPPGIGQKLGSTSQQFMNDGTPLELGSPVRIFNGKDTTGWKAFVPDLSKDGKDPMSVWSVADGVLQCAGRPIGYIQTEALYDNYVLELKWRFDPAKGEGNSGVLLRTVGDDVVWPKSMEAQLHSKNAGDFWNIDPARTDGRRTRKEHATNEKPLGEWNEYRIVMDGGTLELYVNGLLQNRATDVEVVPGRIALQSEGAHIEFKDIVLTPKP